MGAVVILVVGIAIGYVASQTKMNVAETANAATSAADVSDDSFNESSEPAQGVATTAQQEDGAKSTKDDPSLTPWNDPNNPGVLRLNTDDPSHPDGWRTRRLAEAKRQAQAQTRTGSD